MKKYSPLKIALSLLAVLLFVCVAAYVYRVGNSTNIKGDIAGQNTGSDLLTSEPLPGDGPKLEIKHVPPPIIKQEGNVQGQTSIVKFEKDLEISLKIQDVPELWLEYTDKNGEEVRLKLPRAANDILRRRWKRTLELSLQNISAGDREAKLDPKKTYLNDAAVMATQLQEIHISTSLEKRKISCDESFALVHRMAKYAVERFTELNAMSEQVTAQKIRY